MLTCLRGQDEQRDGLLNSLLKQLQEYVTRIKEVRNGKVRTIRLMLDAKQVSSHREKGAGKLGLLLQFQDQLQLCNRTVMAELTEALQLRLSLVSDMIMR